MAITWVDTSKMKPFRVFKYYFNSGWLLKGKFISMGYKSVLKMHFRLLPFRFDESQRVTEFTYLSSRFLSSVLTIAAMQYEFLIKSDS